MYLCNVGGGLMILPWWGNVGQLPDDMGFYPRERSVVISLRPEQRSPIIILPRHLDGQRLPHVKWKEPTSLIISDKMMSSVRLPCYRWMGSVR